MKYLDYDGLVQVLDGVKTLLSAKADASEMVANLGDLNSKIEALQATDSTLESNVLTLETNLTTLSEKVDGLGGGGSKFYPTVKVAMFEKDRSHPQTVTANVEASFIDGTIAVANTGELDFGGVYLHPVGLTVAAGKIGDTPGLVRSNGVEITPEYVQEGEWHYLFNDDSIITIAAASATVLDGWTFSGLPTGTFVAVGDVLTITADQEFIVAITDSEKYSGRTRLLGGNDFESASWDVTSGLYSYTHTVTNEEKKDGGGSMSIVLLNSLTDRQLVHEPASYYVSSAPYTPPTP